MSLGPELRAYSSVGIFVWLELCRCDSTQVGDTMGISRRGDSLAIDERHGGPKLVLRRTQ